ncbi:Ribonuclease H1 [Coemansia linderi]|uniref:Ribonuclease H1 n=1 Tax=Coemansia linderi TaxID=2663919 RepID=A0ACC1KJM7_9FUNG|nr:Ribonuclease H1 [Coemansia linderi]
MLDEWSFVYMRNVDIGRIPDAELGEIWDSLGIDRLRVACASSIGAFLAEFIVRADYVDRFVALLSSITTPEPLDDSLSISVDKQYCPLTPYTHIIPPSCTIPEPATKALDKYARDALTKRWSAMYYAATMPIYVDGAYLPDRGTAGIGAYFENANVAPVAERLPGHQSNARAEVYAMVLALERLAIALDKAPEALDRFHEIWVCSDSRYAVDGVNVYMETWEQTNWLTAKGKPIANRNVFRALHKSMQGLSDKGFIVFVHHLPAHAGIPGNEIADILAKAGALL